MAVGSPTGQPCDVWREHYQYNSASFGSTTGAPTDDFKWLACVSGVPTRTARLQDTSLYAAMAPEDSWIARVRLRKTVNGALT